MPKITAPSTGLETHKLTGHYGFSATPLNALGSSEYTLVTIVVDESGSVSGFKDPLEDAIKQIVTACAKSPRAGSLMIRLVGFSDYLREVHGYKLLSACPPDSYIGCMQIGGSTALFDAAENAISATSAYADILASSDYSANAIVVVLTDGGDNASKYSANNVKAALAKAVQNEHLESLVSILVGVNVADPSLKQYLDDFHKNAGFTQYVDLGNATAGKLAKLAAFVSQSISAQSQALGTGGPSQSLTI